MNTRFITLLLLLVSPAQSATSPSWHSTATGRDLDLATLEPPHASAGPLPVVFYLQNLAAPRVGTEPDEPILRDLRADGFLVVTVDYAHHPRARWPHLNRDLAALRSDLQHKRLLADRPFDPARVYIIPSGHRLLSGVNFFRDAARTLALDIIYPSKPAHPVGTVLEFSCDNANRMGNYSLDFCTDTLLEGAATEGFAVAMADHPVAAPYKGLDAMPDCARKIKAAVRTLRATGSALDLNGRTVPVGFSRGSGMALMLVTTQGRPEFENAGRWPAADSSVQGAVVLSGRFTYLDLLTDDKMIPRYNAVWGPRTDQEQTWRAHGALDYLAGPAPVPLFLSINATESPDALHQMDVLRARLTALGSPFEYFPETEPRGHKVPLAPAVLDPLLAYLRRQLAVADPAPAASNP